MAEEFDRQAKTPQRMLRAFQQIAFRGFAAFLNLRKPSGLTLIKNPVTNVDELAVDAEVPLYLSTVTDENDPTYTNKLLLGYNNALTLDASSFLTLNTNYPTNGIDLDSSVIARVTGWQQRSFSSSFPVGVSGIETSRVKLWMQGGDVVDGDTSQELRVVTARPGVAGTSVSTVTLDDADYHDFDEPFTLPRGSFYATRCWRATYFGAFKSPSGSPQVKFRFLVQTTNSTAAVYTVNSVVPSNRDGISTGGLPAGITAYNTGADNSGGVDLRWTCSEYDAVSGTLVTGPNNPYIVEPPFNGDAGSGYIVVWNQPITGSKWISSTTTGLINPSTVGAIKYETTVNVSSAALAASTELDFTVGLCSDQYQVTVTNGGGTTTILSAATIAAQSGCYHDAVETPFHSGTFIVDAAHGWAAGDNTVTVWVHRSSRSVIGLDWKWGSGNEPDPNATWMLRAHFFTRAYTTNPQMLCFYEMTLLDGPNLYVRRTVGGSIPETIQDIDGLDLDSDLFTITLGLAQTNDHDSANLQFALYGASLEMIG